MKKLVIATLILFSSFNLFAQEGFLGEIRMFAGNYAPRGWALCEGQLLSISANEALYSILGVTYGGDGRVTFGLPDLRARIPMGAGTGPGLNLRRLGEKLGAEKNVLTVDQLPAHNHNVTVKQVVVADEGDSDDPTDHYPAANGTNLYSTTISGTASSAGLTVSSENIGTSQAINNLQPSQCVNFIICLVGTYPSRN